MFPREYKLALVYSPSVPLRSCPCWVAASLILQSHCGFHCSVLCWCPAHPQCDPAPLLQKDCGGERPLDWHLGLETCHKPAASLWASHRLRLKERCGLDDGFTSQIQPDAISPHPGHLERCAQGYRQGPDGSMCRQRLPYPDI